MNTVLFGKEGTEFCITKSESYFSIFFIMHGPVEESVICKLFCERLEDGDINKLEKQAFHPRSQTTLEMLASILHTIQSNCEKTEILFLCFSIYHITLIWTWDSNDESHLTLIIIIIISKEMFQNLSCADREIVHNAAEQKKNPCSV